MANYMIHATNEQEAYVKDFLVPSIKEQGISEYDIAICLDHADAAGMMHMFKDLGGIEGGTWHLKGNIIISKRFGEMTRKYDEGIVYGMCDAALDGGNVNRFGERMPAAYAWRSMACVRIPNDLAAQCAGWYLDHAGEDVWQRFVREKGVLVTNLFPNIVTELGNTARFWTEPELIAAVEEQRAKKDDVRASQRPSRSYKRR